jgi:DNA-binding response OmpR family regulator
MRLLLVEDSARLRESITLGLKKAGYVVDAVTDGEEALWRAKNSAYDLIILDIMIPKIDGLSVLKELRKVGIMSHVLMLTVKDTVEDRVEGLRAGADDYLPKPFAFDELLARIEALIRRSYSNKSTVIQVSSLELNTASRTVRYDGHEVPVTAREYRLLEYLARRQGEVVSRAQIEEHIYSDEKELFSNAVESAISILRKKLETPGAKPLIHTRRGMGYVLQATP